MLATPGTLWIGTVGGLAGYDLTTGQITGTLEALAGHVVDAMLLAPDGALWVGSHWGDEGSQSALDRFAGTEHRRWTNGETPFGADRNWVRALAADNDGGIWASLSNGVQRWDGRAWAEWTGADGGPTNDIFAFLAHGGAMWAAGDSSRGIYGVEQPGRLATPKGARCDGLHHCHEGDPRRDTLAGHQRWPATLWTMKSTGPACSQLKV